MQYLTTETGCILGKLLRLLTLLTTSFFFFFCSCVREHKMLLTQIYTIPKQIYLNLKCVQKYNSISGRFIQ